jgi:hypothetical protein
MKDTFDLWWEWTEKPLCSHATISAELHEAVMALPERERHDRTQVNKAAARRLQRVGNATQ